MDALTMQRVLGYSNQDWNALMKLPVNEHPYDEEFADLLKKYKKCGVNAKRKFKILKKTHFPVPVPVPVPAPVPVPVPETSSTNKRPREDDIQSPYTERIIIDLFHSVNEEDKKAIDELVRLLAFTGNVTKVLNDYKNNSVFYQRINETP